MRFDFPTSNNEIRGLLCLNLSDSRDGNCGRSAQVWFSTSSVPNQMGLPDKWLDHAIIHGLYKENHGKVQKGRDTQHTYGAELKGWPFI